MSKHSPDDIGYKQMFLINKFEKDIMENSLSKMREPKNISNESSNPIKNISKSSQTEEVINESKDDVNLIERKNKDENKMISSDQTKGNDLSEKGFESYDDFRKRVRTAITKVSSIMSENSNTMVVSSGGAITGVYAECHPLAVEEIMDLNFKIKNASITLFKKENETFTLDSFNRSLIPGYLETYI